MSQSGGYGGEIEPAPLAPQPMGVGLVIAVGVRILRKHWAVLLGVALPLVGPAALLTAATSRRFNEVAEDVFSGIDEGTLAPALVFTEAELERLGQALAVYLLAAALAGVLATIATLGFSAVVAADYHGRTIALGAALRACLHRGLSALSVVIVTTLIVIGLVVVGVSLIALVIFVLSGGTIGEGGPGAFGALVVGVTLVLTVIYLTLRWAMAIPVLAIEDQGWQTGLRRSWHLTGDNVWRTLAVFVASSLITAILGAFLATILEVIVVDLLASVLGVDAAIATTVVLAVSSVILAPVAAVFMAVLYFDLRARRDPPPAPASPAS